VLPEQGQSSGSLVRSRASSRRHGAATSSARACRLGYLILTAGCGYSPAPVVTVSGAVVMARPAVATALAHPGLAGTVVIGARSRRCPHLPR
jgi:hypothetical protein